MNLYQLLISSLLSLVVYTIVESFQSWYRLRHIPGPRLAGFSRLWLAITSLGGHMQQVWIDLEQDYDSRVVRVGPNLVTTSDPAVIRRLASARSTATKDEWYRRARFARGIDTLFTVTHTRVHDAYKAKAAAGYSGREVPGIEAEVDEQIAAALQLLREKYVYSPTKSPTQSESDKEDDTEESEHEPEFRPLDLAKFSSYFTLAVITKVAFGNEFGCLRDDSDTSGFMAELQGFLRFASFLSYIPAWMYDVLAFAQSVPVTLDERNGIGLLRCIARDFVSQRFNDEEASDQKKDMLQSFIRHGMTQTECCNEATFMIAAGSDTTSSVIRCTMLHLMAKSRSYQKLKTVIREAIESGVASNPIKRSEGMEIPYLRAVIFEGFRMRNPAPGIHARVVPPGPGENIAGKHVPSGTAVGANVLAILLDKKLFGADAAVFRPERFLEAEERGGRSARLAMEQYVELVFGYGRWQCAGKAVALLELSKIFFELFRHFDFELINPANPIRDAKSYGLWIEEGMMVKVTDSPVA